jgi:LCP family protein required for cell wall assembly
MILEGAAMNAKAVRKSLSILIILLFFVVLASALYIYNGLQKIRRVEIPLNYEELGINPQVQAHIDTGIRNIALFGIDIGRDPKDPPHSDSIIIVTLDNDRNKLKFTSILRDSYVAVEGHKKTKITEAYAYGGPALAIKTLNQNFNLDIKEYITVDFFGLAKIIDAVGGVNIDIEEKELKEINKWTKELYELQKMSPEYIESSGPQKLNGIQAVAYSRIRKIGAGEFDRTRRQRQVLNGLINCIKEKGLTSLPSLIWEITPYVETNISSRDMLTTGTSVLVSSIDNIEQMRFPLDGYCKGDFISGVWYLTLKPDIETTAHQLSEYIYKDIKPEAKKPLF